MTTATVRETEAEAVAFIVGQSVGLDMGTASSDNIQMYAGNGALLAESFEVIQRTSAVILAAIQPENPPERTEPLRNWRKPANRDITNLESLDLPPGRSFFCVRPSSHPCQCCRFASGLDFPARRACSPRPLRASNEDPTTG